jgi:3-methyladenine DNA glycosylase AlkC
MKKKFSLKDHLFNRETVTYLAGLLSSADRKFDGKKFVDDVMEKLLKLELKERIVWIAEVLEQHLPKDFKKASQLIVKALPEELDSTKSDDDFGSFIFAPLGEDVVRNGLTKEHLEDSFFVLHELTRRFSMEDAMRSFINTFPKETLAIYKKWAKDKNYHVRRLVSESTRPTLPWSKRIVLAPEVPIQFLDILYADSTRYVTRSVANHLNDIAKKNPELVIAALSRWKKEGKQDRKELAWMTKHALRTLVKKGDKAALAHLGFNHEVSAQVKQFSLSSHSKKIVRGDTLSFSFEVHAQKDEALMIDYVIDFVKKAGHTKPKVFKIKKISLKKGEVVTITKNHRLIADATTFTLQPGMHMLTLQINGQKFDAVDFKVT